MAVESPLCTNIEVNFESDNDDNDELYMVLKCTRIMHISNRLNIKGRLLFESWWHDKKSLLLSTSHHINPCPLYFCIYLFNLYLTRQVSLGQIIIYNDGLPKGKRPPEETWAAKQPRSVKSCLESMRQTRLGKFAIYGNSSCKNKKKHWYCRVENTLETNLTYVFYSVHGNLTTKVLFVPYVITHSLLAATSQFDGNTRLVGKCANCFYADLRIFTWKICGQLDGNLAACCKRLGGE